MTNGDRGLDTKAIIKEAAAFVGAEWLIRKIIETNAVKGAAMGLKTGAGKGMSAVFGAAARHPYIAAAVIGTSLLLHRRAQQRESGA